jgi:hypothetical protein
MEPNAILFQFGAESQIAARQGLNQRLSTGVRTQYAGAIAHQIKFSTQPNIQMSF